MQGIEHRNCCADIVDEQTFRDFQFQTAPIQIKLLQAFADKCHEPVVTHLARREIDRNAKSVQSRLLQLPCAVTGGLQHPAANVYDQAGLLQNGYEVHWRNVAEFRVVPAQQSFDSANFSRMHVDTRLVTQAEFVALERVTQLVLHLQVLVCLSSHILGVELIYVAPP